MKNSQKQKICYYPKDTLRLRQDVPGAKQWAVALDQTMLTYFTIEPHCSFPSHGHESEQITLVLEGVLYFENEGKIIKVKPGEVIAIPSHVPHAVFTQEKPAKAVDAWSPLMPKYRPNPS